MALRHKHHLVVCSQDSFSEDLYENLQEHLPFHRVSLFPGLDSSPYAQTLPSEQRMFLRFHACQGLLDKGPHVVLASAKSLFLKTPSKSFFSKNHYRLVKGETIAPSSLASILLELGYTPSPTIEAMGSFSERNEIFDIFPIGFYPIRIHFFDDLIEEIYEIDLENQKTLYQKTHENVGIGPSPYLLMQRNFHTNLRRSLPPVPQKHLAKRFRRDETFSQLSQKTLHGYLPLYVPLLSPETDTILDFFSPEDLIIHLLSPESLFSGQALFQKNLKLEFAQAASDELSDMILPSSPLFFKDVKKQENSLKRFKKIKISHSLQNDSPEEETFKKKGQEKNSLKMDIRTLKDVSSQKHPLADALRKKNLPRALKIIRDFLEEGGRLYFIFSHHNAVKLFSELLKKENISRDFQKNISFFRSSFDEGLYLPLEKALVLAENEIFPKSSLEASPKKKQSLDPFSEAFSHLKKGDLVIHSQYGVGRYLGFQKVQTEKKEDFLIIEYRNGDKVYVPAHGLNLVQKCPSSDHKLNSLRSTTFLSAKSRAKKAIKALAFDLLKLQAKRETSRAFAFSLQTLSFKNLKRHFLLKRLQTSFKR